MANQIIIDIGALPNDGTGDPLRTAFNYVNDNFSNVWATGVANSNISFSGNRILTTNTNGDLILAPNGIGKVQANVDIVPSINYAQNLGNVNRHWNTLYTRNIEATGFINGTLGNTTIDVGNLHITGGSNGYVLQTDGDGNLTWTAQTGGTGNGTPGGANTQIQFNNAGTFGGSSHLTWDAGNARLNTVQIGASNAFIYGTINTFEVLVDGNVTANYFIGDGNKLTNINSANINFANSTSNISTTGNISGGYISGNVNAAGTNTQVQFNDNGWLSGHSNFTFDKDTNTLEVPANLIVNNIYSVDSTVVHVHDDLETFGDMTAVGYYLDQGGSLINQGNGTVDLNSLGNVTIEADAQAWNFDTTGTLTFPDNGSGWPIRAQRYGMGNLVAWLDGEWTIGEFNGNTSAPNSGLGNEGIRIDPGIESNAGMTFPAVQNQSSQPVTIYSTGGSGINLYPGGSGSFVFAQNGNLTLPTNSSNINYANGVSILDGVGGNYGNANAVSYGEAGWAGNIIPATSNTYSLGNSTSQWSDLYVSNATIYMNNVPISLTSSNVLTIDGQPVLSDNSSTSITTTGNVTAGGLEVSGSGGDITMTGGNITGANNISVTGNINAGYFIGDGSQLTGLPAGYSNANATSLLADFGSNVISTTGNITAGAFAGAQANVDLIANGYDWTFDTTGNLNLPRNADGLAVVQGPGMCDVQLKTYANTTLYLQDTGTITLETNSNLWSFDSSGVLTFPGNTLQIGLIAGNTGLKSDSANITINTTDAGGGLWNFDTTGNLTAPGDIITTGNVTANNITTAGTGGDITLTGGNISGANDISLTGNIYPGNILTDGYYYANGAPFVSSNYGDSNVTSLLANFGSNNISTAGNVTANTYLGTQSNVEIVAGTYSWTFDNAGVLTAPGNISTTGNVISGNLITGIIHATTVTNLDGTLTVQAGSGYDLVFDPIAANISVSNNYINNLSDPVQPQDAATKKYVDDNAAGLNIHDPVLLASTQDLATYTGATVTYNNGTGGVGANLVFSGNTLTTLDGTSITGGSSTRLLIKNQANAVQNGVYVYTSNSVLTRATDMDQPAEITSGDYVFVQAGATQASSSWVEQGAVGNVGVDNITFVQFSASQSYSAGNALVLNGSQFNVKVDNTTISIGGSNQLTVGTVSASSISGLATVATTGDYANLSNVPTNLNQFTNGPGYITSSTANVISVNGQSGVVTVAEYSNTAVSNYLSSGSYTGNISTTGNITGGYLFGNGSQLTGLPASYGDSNVVTLLATFGSNTVSTTGNVTAGNISTTGYANSGNVYTTNITLSGTGTAVNASGGNILTNQVTGTQFNFLNGIYTATLSGSGATSTYTLKLPANVGTNGQSLTSDGTGNLVWTTPASSYGDSNVVTLMAAFGSNTVSTSGNVTSGNLLTTGLVSATANITGGNLNATTGIANVANLYMNVGYVNTPASAGINIVPGSTATGTRIWSKLVPNANVAFSLGSPTEYWANGYIGNVISTTVSVTANVTGGNLLTGGLISASGNIIGGNIIGNFVSPGANTQVIFNDSGVENATAGFTFNKTTNAVATTGTVSATANITGGNLLTGGIVSATSDIWTGNGNLRTTAATANIFNATPTTVNIAGGASIAVNIGNSSGVVSLSGNVQGNTNGFAIGYRDIPQVTFSGNATITLSDAGKHYYSTSASNLTMTIANSATANFAVGAAINIINQGAGTITIAQGSGVTMYLAGNSTSGNRSLSSYGVATVQKVAADTWFIVGAGVS